MLLTCREDTLPAPAGCNVLIRRELLGGGGDRDTAYFGQGGCAAVMEDGISGNGQLGGGATG